MGLLIFFLILLDCSRLRGTSCSLITADARVLAWRRGLAGLAGVTVGGSGVAIPTDVSR